MKTQLSEIRKTIQEMKVEFNKELLKKSQTGGINILNMGIQKQSTD